MTARIRNVLFLCTHNSARSVLAEVLLAELGRGRFAAFSAGSAPRGTVNPFAIRLLEARGHDTAHVRSKSWDELAAPGAPAMDVVITVCDDAADEVCPVWPGRPATAHWGLADPSRAEGGDEAKLAAFAQTYELLRRRIERLVALPFEALDATELKARLQAIGRMDGATERARNA